MRVLVCGGRNYTDKQRVRDTLDLINATKPITCIIEGGARGADSLAAVYARVKGIRVETYPADWERDGKVAGPIRNQRMLDEGKPHVVIAFPGGKGTADMIMKARRAKVRVVVIEE